MTFNIPAALSDRPAPQDANAGTGAGSASACEARTRPPTDLAARCRRRTVFSGRGGAVAVSYAAQYQMVYAARHLAVAAALRLRSPTRRHSYSPAWAWHWRCMAAMPSGRGC